MKVIIEFVLSAVAVLIAAYIIPGVMVGSFWVAIIVSVVLALVNLIIGSIARILTAPLNFLTFGLISFLISGALVLLTSKLVDGFEISSFWIALVFAFVLGLIKTLFGLKK